MCERPDTANGATHDPSHRAPVYDFVPKHNTYAKCVPHYPSDDDPTDCATNHDPTSYYVYGAHHNAPGINNTRYVSSRWQGQAWCK